MIKFSFTLPSWLHWILPARIIADHQRRTNLTGTASTTALYGTMRIVSTERDSSFNNTHN